jgi:hypothetical protein
MQDIVAAVEAGKTVLVSAREVVRDTWAGVGYIIQDPVTGAGAYLIEGGLNGGAEDPCGDHQDLEPKGQKIADVVFTVSLFVLMVALILAAVVYVPALPPVLAGVGAVAFAVMPAFALPIPQTTEGLWDALFAPRYGPMLNYPDPQQYPGYKFPRGSDGICTNGQRNSLDSWKDEICTLPGSKECRTAAAQRNCPLAAQCAHNAELCIEARLVVMFTCFEGGDAGHWKTVRERLLGLHSCICEMDKKGCPPVFQIP